jgi:VanZ family protein
VAIAGVSSIPYLPAPKINTGKVEIRLDYVFHFCEYGFLTFLALLAFVRNDFALSLKKYISVILCLLIFAFADEFHQKLIPGRAFNVKDILSNLCGIFGGLIFCIIVFRVIAEKLKK